MSTLFDYVESSLGSNLEQWLDLRRYEGNPVREIARQLSLESGVKVSKSTVNLWVRAIDQRSTKKKGK